MSAIPVSEYGKALYYPYFGVRDVNWLKAALLYWDGIRRIGPGTGRHDHVETKQAVEAGLLEETDPEPYIESAAERFRNYIVPLATSPKKFSQAQLNQVIQEMGSAQSPGYQLRVEKMTNSLIWELRERGMAQLSGDWVITERWVGGVYMMCLAMEMSQKIGAPPATHVTALEGLGEYLAFGQPRMPKSKKSKTSLLHLGISLPNSDDLAGVSMKKVLTFHEKCAEERRHFRRAVENIMRKANEIEDPNALSDYLSDQSQDIKEAINNHNHALGFLKTKSAYGLLKISTPAAVTTVATALAPAAATLLAGLGITAGLVTWWAEQRSDMAKEKQSPYHYIVDP